MFDRRYVIPLEKGNYSSWALQKGVFSISECEEIIQKGLLLDRYAGVIGGDNTVVNSIRKSTVAFFDPKQQDTAWIFERIKSVVDTVNKQFWCFDLKFMECIQFTEYSTMGDFYTRHMDMRYQDLEVRKLSVSVQLSDPNSYSGSDLKLFRVGDEFDLAPRDQGTVIFFPSYHIHEVTPIKSGTRYSLVSWIAGPSFR